MNTNQKSMRYDQNDYDALLHSKIPAALVETPQMNFDDASDASVFFARELDYVKSQSYDQPRRRDRHLLQLRQDRHGEDYQQLRHRPAPC